MVLSQQCVQSSQFDSQLVNAQCSDLSVLCVRVSKQLYDEDSFFFFFFSLHLFQASRPAEAAWPLVLESWPKGRTAFSSHINLGVDTISALILRIYL